MAATVLAVLGAGMRMSRQRFYAFLHALGACVLLFRVVTMLSEGALGVLAAWVSVLLAAELAKDLATLAGAVRELCAACRRGK